MNTRAHVVIMAFSLAAGPALAQNQACYCGGYDQNTVTEKVITRTVVIDGCDHDPVCGAQGWSGHRWHRHHWHPDPLAPGHTTGGSTSSGGSTSNNSSSGGSTSGGSTSSSGSTSGGRASTGSGTSGGTTASGGGANAPSSSASSTSGGSSSNTPGTGEPGAGASSSGASTPSGLTSSGATSSGATSSGTTSSGAPSTGGHDLAGLDKRVDRIDAWLSDLGWLAALLTFLLVLPVLLFALWVLRRTRHDTHDITGEGAAEWQAQLRQKDLEIARINEELVTARHAADHAAHTATNTIRSDVEHTEVEHSDVEHAAHRSATGTLIEDAGLVAAGAVAGATVAKSHTASTATHPTGEAAADLHDALRHKDEELDRVKTDLAAARLERERQHDASGAVATIAQTARPIVDTAKAEEAGSIAAGAAVVGAAATTAAHHSANHSAAIDEADWSITHYRVVIGEARAQKHDRPLARSEVIRLSELMLAHYPDDAEAVSFARVSKAEALAEGNDHASALMECETVIAHYASSSNPAVRTQLAHAHFLKAAVHAQHKDVAQTSAALDQWATVYGIFDQRMVTEDNRFRDIMNEPEFQSYVAQKLR